MAFCAMTMTLEIPDEAAAAVLRAQPSPPRALLEAFAVEGYRNGTLPAKKVRVLLGHDSRWETEDFLAAHDVWPGITPEEAAEDGRRLSALPRRPMIVVSDTTPLRYLSVIDEREARRMALARGFTVAGTLTVLAAAGRRGWIDYPAIVATLKHETNFRMTAALIAAAWEAALRQEF